MKSVYNIILCCFLIFAVIISPDISSARGGEHKAGSGHSSRSYSSRSHSSGSYSPKSHNSRSYSPKAQKKGTSKVSSGVKRDTNGRIKRSSAAKHDFMKQSGYSKGRPGYVVDHIVPLKRGGKDDPGNMQWQTKAEAKAKDKWE